MSGIKIFIILTVRTFNLTVVTRSIRFYQLMLYNKLF